MNGAARVKGWKTTDTLLANWVDKFNNSERTQNINSEDVEIMLPDLPNFSNPPHQQEEIPSNFPSMMALEHDWNNFDICRFFS